MDTLKNLQHRILHAKYHRAKEYDLDGDRVDTDEFVYDSDISVEDRVPASRGTTLKKPIVERIVEGEVTSAEAVAQRGVEGVEQSQFSLLVVTDF
jgi:hypothetical protein